ncbi:MAG TPA: ATP-binding protein [Gemmataceae bacterium]|nr:ATP-binding protein [Gemmataceae bacterium]
MPGEAPSPKREPPYRLVTLAFVLLAGALAAEAAAAWLAYAPAAPAAVAALAGVPLVGAALLLLRRDDAARREMMDALRRSDEALKQADRRKDEFLALLAHEQRNSLAPVRSALEVMRLRGPERRAAVCQAREVIERQVRHMARLIDDLLDLSRIARGQVLLHAEPCDLAALVREAGEDHRGPLEGRGVKLTADVPAEPVWVTGDRTRLEQVVGNVLHNANKFTNPGGWVTVSLTASDGEAVLRVRDGGIGMTQETLARAFQSFTQGDGSRERGRGLGLGLALVRGLVELHGGRAGAASDGPGKGSEIVIRLPLGPAGPAPPLPGPHPAPDPRRFRVLIVEDNQDAADSLAMLFALAGHQARVAPTGAEGVRAAREFRPDVVLSDLGLPGGMDGFEVARALRAEPATAAAHLVALTGFGQEEQHRRSRDAGFDRHLVKPVDFDELLALLAALPARDPV